jgi:hypothetical protein
MALNLLHAQSVSPMVLNVTGGSRSFGYTNIDWSVGEMPLVNTYTNQVVVITNGFLQPFTEKPGEINNNNIFTPDEIRVFPNPATSYVEINFLTQQKGNMSFKLYNGTGQLVFQKTYYHHGLGHIERIDMLRLTASEYFLQVVLDPETGSVGKKGGYKIIKLN